MAAGHPFEEIAKRLRSEILSGKRTPGEKLPSENDLQDLWGVSRVTVQRAIQEIVDEGLAVTVPKKGAFVRAYDRSTREVELDTVNREFGATVEVGLVATPTLLEEPAPVEPGVFRRRVVGGSILETYWARSITNQVPELASPAPLEHADLLLLVRVGIKPIRGTAEVIARMPTREESGLLDIVRATPVLEQRVCLFCGRRPIGMRFEIYPGDRHMLQYDLAPLDDPEA
ncbi:GntR family transcriptional regulator [Nonomuraea sp. NPDC003707]